MSVTYILPKNRLSTIQSENLKDALNKAKEKSLKNYFFSKILNDIGNILKINIIYISYDMLQIIIHNSTIFSDNLSKPNFFTRQRRTLKNAFKSTSRRSSRTQTHNISKPCNKNIIGKIHSTDNPNDEKAKQLFSEFNEFINNDNCLDKKSLVGPEYIGINVFFNNADSKLNVEKQFLRLGKDIASKKIIYMMLITHLKITDTKIIKQIKDIIDYYFSENYQILKKNPKAPDSGPDNGPSLNFPNVPNVSLDNSLNFPSVETHNLPTFGRVSSSSSNNEGYELPKSSRYEPIEPYYNPGETSTDFLNINYNEIRPIKKSVSRKNSKHLSKIRETGNEMQSMMDIYLKKQNLRKEILKIKSKLENKNEKRKPELQRLLEQKQKELKELEELEKM